MTAILTLYKVDLSWADNQYWTTLFKVMRELNTTYNPPKKVEVSNTQMQSFIKN